MHQLSSRRAERCYPDRRDDDPMKGTHPQEAEAGSGKAYDGESVQQRD
jgi:hypothetical protein